MDYFSSLSIRTGIRTSAIWGRWLKQSLFVIFYGFNICKYTCERGIDVVLVLYEITRVKKKLSS